MSQVSLKSLLAPNKEVTIDFPGYDGFKVTLGFLSREALLNLRKKATKTTYKGRQAQEDFDEDLFLKLYAELTIKGWEGLKFSYLDSLAPVDLSGVNPDDMLEFSSENALYMMKNSTVFDSFVSETVIELGNFSTLK